MNLHFVVPLVLVTLFALWAGGWPERIGAAVYALSVAATYLTLLMHSHILRTHSEMWLNLEAGVFIVDAVTFIIFVAIALRADRFWPLWVSAFLGIGLLGHLAKLMLPDTFWRAYAFVLAVWSYPILALIALGTFLHWRRKRAAAGRFSTRSSARSAPAPTPGPTSS